MAEIVPVDVFLDGWYPGWTPELIEEPWLRMRCKPFSKEDEARFWFADFHWPRGFSPLAFHTVCVLGRPSRVPTVEEDVDRDDLCHRILTPSADRERRRRDCTG